METGRSATSWSHRDDDAVESVPTDDADDVFRRRTTAAARRLTDDGQRGATHPVDGEFLTAGCRVTSAASPHGWPGLQEEACLPDVRREARQRRVLYVDAVTAVDIRALGTADTEQRSAMLLVGSVLFNTEKAVEQ